MSHIITPQGIKESTPSVMPGAIFHFKESALVILTATILSSTNSTSTAHNKFYLSICQKINGFCCPQQPDSPRRCRMRELDYNFFIHTVTYTSDHTSMLTVFLWWRKSASRKYFLTWLHSTSPRPNLWSCNQEPIVFGHVISLNQG